MRPRRTSVRIDCSGAHVFRRDSDEPEDGLDMIRIVDDEDAESLRRVSDTTEDPSIEGALGDSIDYFLMATAARWCRGQEREHSTMLIHTSQRVAVHNRFAAPGECRACAICDGR